MKINLLAINVGNCRTQLGTFIDNQLADSGAVDNNQIASFKSRISSAFEPLAEQQDAVVMLASVEPEVAGQIATLVPQVLGRKIVRVEEDVVIPIGRQLDSKTMVGDDRLLNAAAAFEVLKQACIVVDAGTAITVDFVDGTGTFHGGAIGPGASMMLAALHDRTAMLPQVELRRPKEPMGHNTTEAIRAGVYYGLRGMVRELVEVYAERAGVYPMVVATGGDAQLLFDCYDLVDRIVPDLTLLGMAATMRSVIRDPAET